jgi:hypothetical protein
MKLLDIVCLFIFMLASIMIFLSLYVDFRNFEDYNYIPLKISKIKRQTYDIDCSLIIENDQNEIKKAKQLLDKIRKWMGETKIPLIDDKNYIFHSSECNLYRSFRKYNDLDDYVDKLEFNFPLAFIIHADKSVEQFERLFRSIYRSHNFYCINVNIKSSYTFNRAIKSISSCFNNVFINDSEYLIWGEFSILQSQLNCMKKLMEFNGVDHKLKISWKYLLNLKSDDFPLIINYDLVKLLMFYNGANEIQIQNGLIFTNRYNYVYKLNEKTEKLVKTDYIKSKPPHGYKIMKGQFNYAISREFTKYILNNPKVNDLIQWLNDTYAPYEM